MNSLINKKSEDIMQSINRPTQAGFTLVEMMIVVILLGILAAWAVPSFATLLSNTATRKASSEIVSVFNQARSAASMRQGARPATINVNTTTNKITISFIDPANAQNNQVFYSSTLEERIKIKITSPSTSYVINSQGKMVGAVTAANFQICDNKVANRPGYSVAINANGIARVASGGC